MSERLFVVMATEDDYYPDIRAIGAFKAIRVRDMEHPRWYA